MRKSLRLVSAIVICSMFQFAARIANAASITWNVPTAITTNGSASDVVNLGKEVEAQYADGGGAGTQTVNGITFTEGFTNYATPNGETTGALNFSTGNAAYNTVLNGFAYDGNDPNVLTLTGLTPGAKYEIQLWGVDDRDCCSGRTEAFSDGTNASTTFALGTNVSVVGTFTANGTTQLVDVVGVGQSQNNLNAFSLTVMTPEPASIVALAGLAGMGLIGFTLRRRRAV